MKHKKILSQNTKEYEVILENLMKKIIERNETINIFQIEELMQEVVSNTIELIRNFVGEIVSNLNFEGEKICPKCKRKSKIIKRNSKINIMTMFGEMVYSRDYFYCRYCHEGYGRGDNCR